MQQFPQLKVGDRPLVSDLVVYAMSGLNALSCILQTCGGFLQGEGTCFLVMWGGEEAVVRQVAFT